MQKGHVFVQVARHLVVGAAARARDVDLLVELVERRCLDGGAAHGFRTSEGRILPQHLPHQARVRRLVVDAEVDVGREVEQLPRFALPLYRGAATVAVVPQQPVHPQAQAVVRELQEEVVETHDALRDVLLCLQVVEQGVARVRRHLSERQKVHLELRVAAAGNVRRQLLVLGVVGRHRNVRHADHVPERLQQVDQPDAVGDALVRHGEADDDGVQQRAPPVLQEVRQGGVRVRLRARRVRRRCVADPVLTLPLPMLAREPLFQPSVGACPRVPRRVGRPWLNAGPCSFTAASSVATSRRHFLYYRIYKYTTAKNFVQRIFSFFFYIHYFAKLKHN